MSCQQPTDIHKKLSLNQQHAHTTQEFTSTGFYALHTPKYFHTLTTLLANKLKISSHCLEYRKNYSNSGTVQPLRFYTIPDIFRNHYSVHKYFEKKNKKKNLKKKQKNNQKTKTQH
eukprot:561590_1